MSSAESQKILAAYARYKKTDLNRNNRRKLQEALNAAKQRATRTLNQLQQAFAPSQRIVQNFPTNEAIEQARQRALQEVAERPSGGSGGSSPSNFQQQARDFYNRNMPPNPAAPDPTPTVGEIVRTTDLLLSRLPKIPTTREQYNSIYAAYTKLQTDYAAWLQANPKPYLSPRSGRNYHTWLRSTSSQRRDIKNWEKAKVNWAARIRAARVNWEQASWGQKNIEIRIAALKPFLDLEDLTRPEIAKAHNEITAASNVISRILNQKLFVERQRLGDLQKLMLVVLDKKKEAERLNAEALRQHTFAEINPSTNPNLQPPPGAPLPPEPTAPQSTDLGTQIGEAIKGAFGGSQAELTTQAIMVMRANIAAAKALEAEQ